MKSESTENNRPAETELGGSVLMHLGRCLIWSRDVCLAILELIFPLKQALPENAERKLIFRRLPHTHIHTPQETVLHFRKCGSALQCDRKEVLKVIFPLNAFII